MIKYKLPKFEPERLITYRDMYPDNLFIVNPNDKEVMEYYELFGDDLKNYISESRNSPEYIMFVFGRENSDWTIYLYCYKSGYCGDAILSMDNAAVNPKYKIVHYFKTGEERMQEGHYHTSIRMTISHIKECIDSHKTASQLMCEKREEECKRKVMYMTSSPSADYLKEQCNKYFGVNKNPYIKTWDTIPDDALLTTQWLKPAKLSPDKKNTDDEINLKFNFENDDLLRLHKAIFEVKCKKEEKERKDAIDNLVYYAEADALALVELYKNNEKEINKMKRKNEKSRMLVYPFNGMTGLKIKKVIFNGPATIIEWDDYTKTIVKCQNGEPFDQEKGVAMAICKKLLGNTPYFNNYIKKWVAEAQTPDKKANT